MDVRPLRPAALRDLRPEGGRPVRALRRGGHRGDDVTREEAWTIVTALARGLTPDAEGVRILLERVAAHDQAEALRAHLTEIGARARVEAALGRRWGNA